MPLVGEDVAPAWRIRAGARLHLGFLDLAGDLGRRFGSLGLAIDGFETQVVLRRAKRFVARGWESGRVEALVRALADAHAVSPDVEVEVASAIPAHVGLGSGTQLALSVAHAFRRVFGLPLDTDEGAALLMRGARSGIGVALFDRGGFVIDGGRGAKTATPPIVTHLPFPADWRAVLLIDRESAGAHGEAEHTAFAALPAFPPAHSAEICRRALMQIAPSVAEADFTAFGEGIGAVQRVLGDYFAPAQGGGRFTSSRVGRVASALEKAGALGVGQSSWGPTGFVFARDPDEAEHWAAMARAKAAGQVGVEIHAARARGAECAALTEEN